MLDDPKVLRSPYYYWIPRWLLVLWCGWSLGADESILTAPTNKDTAEMLRIEEGELTMVIFRARGA